MPQTLPPGAWHSPGLGGHGAHEVTPQKAPTLPQQSSWAVSSSKGLAHWKKGHRHPSYPLPFPAVHRAIPGKPEARAQPQRPATGMSQPREERRESGDAREGSRETCSPSHQTLNLGPWHTQIRKDLLCAGLQTGPFHVPSPPRVPKDGLSSVKLQRTIGSCMMQAFPMNRV